MGQKVSLHATPIFVFEEKNIKFTSSYHFFTKSLCPIQNFFIVVLIVF